MKTAVTVLQEIMVKLGQTPEYECISQSGPQHLAIFEYRCKARGMLSKATARSKKEAKQEAARQMLMQMALKGEPVPPPFNRIECTPAPEGTDGKNDKEAGSSAIGSHSFVVLLKDLCEEYHLPGVYYELVGDTGPPHMREFTMRVSVGQHVREATSTTKKAARQLAAEKLYTYMRENLHRLTKDFVEEEALVRTHERAMERYVELRDPEVAWRPDLGQRIADYHLGLKNHIDEDKRVLARGVLASLAETGSTQVEVIESGLNEAVAALGLTASWSELDGESGPLPVLELVQTSPALAFSGVNRRAAIISALRYLRIALE